MAAIFQQIGRYLQTIGPNDILDILIIAALLYALMMIGRRSQASQVLKGVGVVFFVLVISDIFNLHVTNFLLSTIVQVGFLALVILFQPEIRRFLTQIGSMSFRRFLRYESNSDTIEHTIHETVEAYRSMSHQKIGALTVFERNGTLNDYIRSGTALDCAVSAELMKNIFWPKAPLHDGAVIIRDGRIVGGGCVLPLSGNANISRELGTRHRAGLGVTEHSDAVVVICSEETGSISVAVDGMLKRHLAPETLERLLRTELITADPSESRLGMPASVSDFWQRLKSVLEKGGPDDVE